MNDIVIETITLKGKLSLKSKAFLAIRKETKKYEIKKDEILKFTLLYTNGNLKADSSIIGIINRLRVKNKIFDNSTCLNSILNFHLITPVSIDNITTGNKYKRNICKKAKSFLADVIKLYLFISGVFKYCLISFTIFIYHQGSNFLGV